MSKIEFNNADTKAVLKNKRALRQLIRFIFENEKKELLLLSIILCSDEYLLALNNNFLRHNYYTDILTFELSGQGDPIEGELYISIDRTNENARALNLSHDQEISRVIIHGALHLCGYKDHTKRLKQIIHAKEDHYLLKLNVLCST